jgi:hypothetical protein
VINGVPVEVAVAVETCGDQGNNRNPPKRAFHDSPAFSVDSGEPSDVCVDGEEEESWSMISCFASRRSGLF